MELFGPAYERRIVLFTDSNNFYQLKNDDKGRELLINSQVKVLDINKSDDFKNSFKILGGIAPTSEMMLVISPFDDLVYMEISEAKNLVALEKLGCTIQLSQYLGAKYIKILSGKIHDKETNQSIHFDGTYKGVKGDLDISKRELLNFKDKISLETTFNGGEPEYEIAKAFLIDKRIIGDVFLSKLLEMRNPVKTKSNPIKNFTQEICLTENLQNTLDIVAKLSIPLGFFSANYKTFVKEKTEISLTIQIDF